LKSARFQSFRVSRFQKAKESVPLGIAVLNLETLKPGNSETWNFYG
jgi:hypothetical protein